ncbi:hypothetical protein EON79_05470, partial [bacterium]
MGPLSALVLLSAPFQLTEADALVQMRKAAVPIRTVEAKGDFRDLEPLRRAIGGAKIVGLGEATHGSREIFQMKHRLFAFLVERMGFTVFALESSMPKTIAMDRYVTTGEGDLDAAVKAQGFWTWDTEEVRDLLVWMWTYNKNPRHRTKLRVVGVDMQDAYSLWEKLIERIRAAGVKDPAVEETNWYFTQMHAHHFDGAEVLAKAHDLIAAATPAVRKREGEDAVRLLQYQETILRQALADGRKTSARESMLDEHRGTGKALPDLSKKAAERLKSAPDAPELARWGLDILARWNEIAADPGMRTREGVTPRKLREAAQAVGALKDANELRTGVEFLAVILDFVAVPAVLPRDLFMADNLEWVRKTYLPGSKVVFWAHNSHVGRSRMAGHPATVGAYLGDRMKTGYYPLGSAFGEGSFRSSGESMGIATFTV